VWKVSPLGSRASPVGNFSPADRQRADSRKVIGGENRKFGRKKPVKKAERVRKSAVLSGRWNGKRNSEKDR